MDDRGQLRVLVDLSSDEVGLIVDVASGIPQVLHWGTPGVRPELFASDSQLVPFGGLDAVAPLTMVPLHGDGFLGRPGLLGRRRGGRDWSPRFTSTGHDLVAGEDGGKKLVARAVDPHARLSLGCGLAVHRGGAITARAVVTNDGDSRYLVDGLTISLPVPAQVGELVMLTGRWIREAQLLRLPWPLGTWTSENRAGRTSHEHVPLVWAVEPGAGEWHGSVWGAHLAWSGNHVLLAECLPDGRRYLQLGELLHPGEVSLEPGESYATPTVVAVTADNGLTPASWGFHRWLRARPGHPGPDRPRPVLLNTWEAVYFDHDAQRLRALADAAAAVGVERFVLDDGWFGSRRDDTKGLGDWTVSPDAHPEGLGPLIEHVRSLGMEFGIWVEPEMVNPDSDLFRGHPDWALATPDYDPVLGRHQLVLDLGRPEAFDHVLGQLDRLLGEHEIAFVKWDMNRPHVQGSGARGTAGTHEQTQALYRLLDELRSRHPGVEFESCASGGGRVDLEILQRAERVWVSDCNDPVERQLIQRGWSMLIPPEVMGAHIGPPAAHTTGRRTSLAFRGATALFGHLGVEWDLLRADEEDRAALAAIIDVHQRFRSLLHGGDTVRFDLASNGTAPDAVAHGVYAPTRDEALVSYVQLGTGASLVPPRWRLPGLDPERTYRVEHVPLPGGVWGLVHRQPTWMVDPAEVTGAELAVVGLQPPSLLPQMAVLVHLTATG